MPHIQFLSPAQEALIPEYQEKWRDIYCSTQRIDPVQAEAAIHKAYKVMGRQAPEVIICPSPRVALSHLQAETTPVDIPTNTDTSSSERVAPNFWNIFFQAIWQVIVIRYKRRKADTKPLLMLFHQVSKAPAKPLARHIDHCLPKDLTTQNVVEQSLTDTLPFFTAIDKRIAHQGNHETVDDIQNSQPEDWQDSINMTASALNTQLAWLPAKNWFFRGWLKRMSQATLVGKIYGMEHPDLQGLLSNFLSLPEQTFLLDHPAIFPTTIAIYCTWFDFAFSVLGYSYPSKKWEALQDLVNHCGWIFAADDRCFVCDRPIAIRINDTFQLHGEGVPALEFSDGFSLYAYHGTPIPEAYGSVHPDQWQSQWILDESRPNLQQVLIQGIGPVRLCQDLPMTTLGTLQDYTLLNFGTAIGLKDTQVLKRVDPETGTLNAVFVPWSIRSVRQAIEHANQNISADDFPLPE